MPRDVPSLREGTGPKTIVIAVPQGIEYTLRGISSSLHIATSWTLLKGAGVRCI